MTVEASTTSSIRATRAWARRVVDETSDSEPLELVERVVAAVAAAVDGEPCAAARAGLPEPPGGFADPWLPGVVHEQAVSAGEREGRGAWYTPEPVVRGLVRLALAVGGQAAGSSGEAPVPAPPPMFTADPTCGGGAFLLAALDELVDRGVPAEEAPGLVAGMDIDPGAVQVTRWALDLWAAANGVGPGTERVDVTVGDALVDHPAAWPATRIIVGNPPFATPLRSGAVVGVGVGFRRDNSDRLGPYADLAAMHLLATLDRCGPGSTVALVQPQSVLSGRDTAGLRAHCDDEAPLQGLWAAREPVFDAGVRTCAPVLRPGAAPAPTVAVAAGIDVTPVGAVERRRADGSGWARFAVRALGGPALPAAVETASPAGHLGDLATATAGFRDEFYGLVAACMEWTGPVGEEPNRLLTVGLVEPLTTAWGTTVCRFGRKRWHRPWIDTAELDDKVLGWTERQLVPKIVLATQSKVLEPVIDRTGSLVPATPLIAVHADRHELDLVAAVLLAPPVVAWAWERWFGSAMAVDALKLAARQVAELPLPPDRTAWEEAAAVIAAGDGTAPDRVAVDAARIMNRAYGGGEDVLGWWLDRAGLAETHGGPRDHAG